LRDAAEIPRRAYVDDQDHRQFSLFGEFLHECRAKPRRDVPIDRPYLVTRLVLAHVLEVHPASLENAVVITREHRLHETLRLDLKRADFL
jgi:hypothetical protein